MHSSECVVYVVFLHFFFVPRTQIICSQYRTRGTRVPTSYTGLNILGGGGGGNCPNISQNFARI